ncbi:MAG TPA: hypothetical protein H9850_05435 [Candidatus Anaerobiospirillum pullistercoris]|uniref:Uncharacterized protein n=1 Tax=Candidatus Anaerobiospirillum pullistercoris TaxID=2838452 RepID=A0A9D1WCY7_9GAMM|nr:hypothetical protein [Candidatus Anaerobiospirillum pullistercoris]
MMTFIKQHKTTAWLLALLAACGIAIAAADLAGNANKTCADAGLQGANTEMMTLDLVKQSESNPIDWQQERKLRKAIDAQDAKYQKLVAQAQNEIQGKGSVEAANREAGLACASDFKAASETYAAFWDQNNGITRAKLARQAGEARMKNAEMTFNELDSDRVAAYNEEMDKLAQARSEYMEEAKTDVSEQDRAAMKADLTPRINTLMTQGNTLVQNILSLIDQVKASTDSLASGDIGAITSCASTAVSGDGPMALLSPLTSLLDLVKSFISNLQSFSSDLESL